MGGRGAIMLRPLLEPWRGFVTMRLDIDGQRGKPMRIAAILIWALALTLLGAGAGHAEKRVALVIGNAAYRAMPALQNPRNDAEDVGTALRDLAFETVIATDLDRTGMNEALDRFARTAADADIAIIYYSGHGMQLAGTNYLLPVDARLDSMADVNRFRLVPVEDVLETVRSVRGARVLILDACRNNPAEDELKRRLASVAGANRDAFLTRGLGRVSAGNGLVVAYATQANDVASDGVARNSPFTAAFIKHVGTPDLDLRQMLFRVQDEVDEATKHKQRPELSISLVGEFKLKVVVNVSVEAAKPVGPPALDPAAQAWAEAKGSTSQAVLESFIRRFGDSFYADLARARLDELKAAQTAMATPAPPPTANPPARPNAVDTVGPCATLPPNSEAYRNYRCGAGGSAAAPAQPGVAPQSLCETLPIDSEAYRNFNCAAALDKRPNTPRPTVAAVAAPVLPAAPCGTGAVTASVSSRAACPLSAAEERSLKPKDMFKECEQCPEMVVVPAGSFMMGTPRADLTLPDEGPQHSVTIPRKFAVGAFHVTVDQFAVFVAATGYDAGSACVVLENGDWRERDRLSWRDPGFEQSGAHPAVCLSWDDAKAYVDWLAGKTGKAYRLLTEAEWEYAARAGTTTKYFFGDTGDRCQYGNGWDETAARLFPGVNQWAGCSDGFAYTSPVGRYSPNAFGLFDMHGNAGQWVEDCYHSSYDGAPATEVEWTSGSCSQRMVRGGSWLSAWWDLRAAFRTRETPLNRSHLNGFRVARSIGR
jgi:formylglycine-generating enzyme required for sulfatase activity/uncharacterized caspase-like protein